MKAGAFVRKRALILRRAGDRAAFARRAIDKLAREFGAVPAMDGRRAIGWLMPDGSIACDKLRYREEVDARLELLRIAKHSGHRAHVPVRAYACPWCHGWHLTSRE